MSDKDELRNKNYDGIQEYDNDLPGWWLGIFWVTIIFSIVYPFIYDFGPGKFASETVEAEVAEVRSKASGPNSVQANEGSLLKLTSDSTALAMGKDIFATKCAACHSPQGQGLIGPNLTDDFWIHGGGLPDIQRVVTEGVLEKGMIAWRGQLTPDQINAVSAYIWTLRGTNPPNPKEPQGEKYERK